MSPNPAHVLKSKNPSMIARASELCRNLYATSGQSMYLYLDDNNKSCNPRFAKLLGYANPEAWAAVQTSFPQAFVDSRSQEALVDAFQTAREDGNAGSVPITWKRKDGKTVDTNVILVPLDVDGQRLALHFISEV